MQLRRSAVHDVTCGEDMAVYEPANLCSCILDDNVFVGPFVEIQDNTQIGVDSKVQPHALICEYVTLGARCFIGHGVMSANDMLREGKPDADHNNWGRVPISSDISAGNRAIILTVTICDGTVIGTGNVVTKLVVEKGVYTGNPAKLLRHL